MESADQPNIKKDYITGPLRGLYFVFIIYTIIFLIPFIICDLYYAYIDTCCLNLPITAYSIYFTLDTWLKVIGWLYLCFCGILILFGVCMCYWDEMVFILMMCCMIIGICMCIFNVIWMVIGGIMFWGDIYKTDMCNKNINNYMNARLIINWIVIGLGSVYGIYKVIK